MEALKGFYSLDVDFFSSQENIDTTAPQGEMIFMVMASLAQFERVLISERVIVLSPQCLVEKIASPLTIYKIVKN